VTSILVVDNYDSFVYNIVQYLAQLGAEVEVWRNDDARFSADWAKRFDGVLLSPGPGTPQRAGVCVDLIREYAGKLPIFGVCLGMQAICVSYGGTVSRAPELLHGKTSLISHDQEGVFAGLPNPITATRYHSLALDPASTPAELKISATAESGVVMAVRHRSLPVEGVQFHPESVLTQCGHRLLANWLAVCGAADAPRRAADLKVLLAG
jgi:para-aminobenzoate synthetase component 2